MMTQEEAEEFFNDFFGGAHHTPPIKRYGLGYCVNTTTDLATYDGDNLTNLVLMAHKYLYRVSISAASSSYVKIIITKRKPEGRLCERHPDLEKLISMIEAERKTAGLIDENT
jgi:hypothetical protein